MQKDFAIMKERLLVFEESLRDVKKESELELREAKLRAQKIIQDAEGKSKNIFLKKDRIERELKEFIQAEKELIKKYEELS